MSLLGKEGSSPGGMQREAGEAGQAGQACQQEAGALLWAGRGARRMPPAGPQGKQRWHGVGSSLIGPRHARIGSNGRQLQLRQAPACRRACGRARGQPCLWPGMRRSSSRPACGRQHDSVRRPLVQDQKLACRGCVQHGRLVRRSTHRHRLQQPTRGCTKVCTPTAASMVPGREVRCSPTVARDRVVSVDDVKAAGHEPAVVLGKRGVPFLPGRKAEQARRGRSTDQRHACTRMRACPYPRRLVTLSLPSKAAGQWACQQPMQQGRRLSPVSHQQPPHPGAAKRVDLHLRGAAAPRQRPAPQQADGVVCSQRGQRPAQAVSCTGAWAAGSGSGLISQPGAQPLVG